MGNRGPIMITQDVRFSVLALNEDVRKHLLSMLRNIGEFSVVIVDLDGILNSRVRINSIILIDSEAVLAYGTSVISKIKMASPEGRLIVLCSQAHRGMIKHIMELGAYGCIIEPYPEWEFSTMIRPTLIDRKTERKAKANSKRQGKKLLGN